MNQGNTGVMCQQFDGEFYEDISGDIKETV